MGDAYRQGAERPVTEYSSDRVDNYVRFRPCYAEAAIDSMLKGLSPLDDGPIVAADVGCGTGISSRQLAARDVRVYGVEPNHEMRGAAKLARGDLSIEFRDGTAERSGLDEASVDLVLCAQSFHWFQGAPALAEFHRILRPSGRLALMWNVRQPGNPFSATYKEIVQRAQAAADEAGRLVRRNRTGDPTEGGWFANRRVLTFPNPCRYDLAGILGRTRSTSYFPAHGPLREELEAALRQAFHACQSGGGVTLDQRTELILADRSDKAPE